MAGHEYIGTAMYGSWDGVNVSSKIRICAAPNMGINM